MKHIIKYLILSTVVIGLITGCDKKDTVTFASAGNASVLSSSATKIAPLASDSSKPALVLKWTNPSYATDSSSVRYLIQIDSSGRNFSEAASFVVSGALKDTLTAKQLNDVLLSFGFKFKVAYNVDIRVVSSYANNNVALTSNTITVNMTPYVIPPVINPPASGTLFLVGDATQGGWANPVPAPSQQFAQLDSVTYGGVFNLIGGNQYLILPVNGSWDHKYGGASVSGGTLLVDNAVPGSNTPAPAVSGTYIIIVDFQHGTYSVTPFVGSFTDSLYAVGDATPGGWANPVPVPSQQFTQDNSGVFELTLTLASSGSYLFLPKNGDWGHKFGGASATGGALFADNSVPGSNTPAPTASGNYKVVVNFITSKYTVTPK